MSSTSLGAYGEHHFKRVIPGEIESVRRILIDVLEQFNYVIVSDNPIQAKRAAQKSLWVADILEYEVRLTVLLKAANPASTVATFDYAVPYIFTNGDRLALEREAEAIIALATTPMSRTVCPSCGAEATDAARFCRSCGAPVAGRHPPAEVELMRMTAGLSAAQLEITIGLGVTVLALVVTLPMILGSDGKAANIGWVMLALGALFASFLLQQGMRRLHRALHPHTPAQPDIEAGSPPISAQERVALAPPPASVTEGTTELMMDSLAPVPVRLGKDTDPIDS